MRKILSRTMLMLATVAMAVPSVSAQTAVKHGAHTGSAQAKQNVEMTVASGPQMLVRSSATTSSRSFSYVPSSLTYPTTSAADQMRQATGGVELWGNVIYSDKPEGSSTNAHLGIWKVNTSGEFTSVYPNSLGGCYTAVYVDGVYHNFYAASLLGMNFYYYKAYDTDDWTQLSGTPSVTAATMPYSLCTDGTNVYGTYIVSNAWKFGKLDLNTLTWTPLGDVETQWNGCAYANDGNIYAIDMAGDFFKVTTTGTITKIGATGAVPKYITGATIDKKSGRMFWAVSPEDESGNLYEVNITTGQATKLCQFTYNDEIAGLFIPFIAEDKAPAAVSSLNANFSNGSLSGTVGFKCPTTLYDGTAASGSLTYKVLANGQQVATGSTSYGATVNANVTVPLAGDYTFTVLVSNSVGDGPKTKTSLYVGKDTPNPTTVNISYANGKFHVAWTAVTTTVNGGYMDLSKVNYTVRRMPDNVVVANGTTATSLDDAVAMPDTYKTYYYTVVVNCDGLSSSPAQSNSVGLGELAPPYTQTFEDAASVEDFVIIDANNDGKTWAYYSSEKAVRCTYHSSNAMDDWFITPSIKLEAGKVYRLSFDCRNNGASYPERIEVKMGNAPTVEAMTTEVMASADIIGAKEWISFEEYLVPTTTGNYNIGFHGVSDKNMFYLYLDNLEISAPMDGGAPGAATALTATADATGALKATISGKAPTTTINNQSLGSISKVEISRDGTVVKTLTGINPGATFSWTDDNVGSAGNHTWSVVCSNDKGAGKKAEVSCFVGFDKPSPVTDVTIVETTPGTVKLTWTAPTTDVNGKTLNPADITYTIVDASNTSTVYAQDLTTTEATVVVNTEGQDFFTAGIFAVNATGNSEGVASDMLAVGAPYTMPYFESFAEGTLSYNLGLRHFKNSATWNIQNDGSLCNSSDGDNGYISCKQSYLDDKSMCFTGKVDLTNAGNPSFSFYLYNISSVADDGTLNRDINEIDVMIREANVGDWVSIKHATVDELCGGDTAVWKQVRVNLAAYKGKVVQIGVANTCKFFVYTFIDRMEVKEDLANNLSVASISAPATVKPQEEFAVNVTVENQGGNSASGYTVEFYRNDASEPFKTIQGPALASGASASFNAPVKLGFEEADSVARFHAEVKFAADENTSDNVSKEVVVSRKYSNKPTPNSLNGTYNDNDHKVHLTWNAPASEAPRTASGSLDDVESYESWAYENVGDWTFIDGDKSPVGGFQNTDLPNNPLQSLRSFFVFDCTSDSFNQTFDAHSGTKYFAALFRYDDGTTDDWLISPLLSGSAQTISFWARSYSTQYPEKIRILYSTTGLETTNFVEINTVASVPGDWTQYTADLPAGAKYFAINSCATGSFMLMLDDFTYETTPDVVKGYNVYRDGVKLNSELVTSTNYTDEFCPAGEHDYHVTAVYESGEESAPTNKFTATMGVNTIEAGVSVEAGKGFIAINGAEGKAVAIIDIKGVMYINTVAEGDIRVELPAGVYLVRVANGNLKVVVK